MDWDDLKTFLAVARYRNLSAAARFLGVAQTTVGRRLDSLQNTIGAKLFQKKPDGFVLTVAGQRILAEVEEMESTALGIERAIVGADRRLEGTVRITTVDPIAVEYIAPSLAAFHRRYPRIVIELNCDQRPLSLARREADIALRTGRFDQQEVLVRKVFEMKFGVYASREYLTECGEPDFAAGCPGHRKLSMEVNLLAAPFSTWFERQTSRADVALRSNNFWVRRNACAAGLGFTYLPEYVGLRAEELVALEGPTPPHLDIRMGVHRDMRRTPRIRAVMTHLMAHFSHLRASGVVGGP